MLEIKRKRNAILFKFSSEISTLTNTMDKIEKFLKVLNTKDPTNVLLVARELLMNAVVHGNRNDPNRFVICRLRAFDNNQLKILVKDEGAGFDYESLDLRLPNDPKHIQKRGYILINALSERIDFKGRGNSVTVYVKDVNGGIEKIFQEGGKK